MLPTEDEKTRIAEAQMANPDVPLGTAEQFLLTLSSISELEARLRLWAFRLDYETLEREVAEPLMDLKQAIKEIESSDTFRVILSTLRSIKGFHIEYLSKVPEVKDTVQKHSLLHHLCHIVMEKFPKSSDLYSESGSVPERQVTNFPCKLRLPFKNNATLPRFQIDYGEVTKSLNKMESECKASWDYLKAILKHDCNITLKVRTTEFLTDCAERIIVLKVIHRRMINRYSSNSWSTWVVPVRASERAAYPAVLSHPSEFALEYRTTRERVLAADREESQPQGEEQDQREAHHRYPKVGYCARHKRQGQAPQIGPGGSLGRHSAPAKEEADDEILESLVKTATTQPARTEPRIRKKARYGDRKSLRRTLKGGLELSEEERNILSTMTT
ncbi:hypothetical protein CEXT_222601 [Caerostris extrusa]|uniref:FH2 domain-containing protein n=1 Tax=Caerostris extrusa TaxID=172846 RepID=A0AAV4Q6Z4_CAEEX|nr:hypothetical protein CEXT_222601 [Caerostris extrusa]